MLKKIFIIALILTPLCVFATNIAIPSALKQSKELILVITKNWYANQGKLQYFQRKNGAWHAISRPFKIFVGKTGLAWNAAYHKFNLSGPYKTEGDNKSPAGAFPLKYSFGFAQTKDKKIKLKYIPLKNSSVCVADSSSKYYNQIIDREKVTAIDWQDQEIMRSTTQYRYGIFVDYNRPNAQPYYGSCIFVHIWNQPNSRGTAGCTSMAEKNLKKLLYWLNPSDNPVIVQLPQKQYALLKSSWQLP
jgi:D-alanyl-D-alanine dipeptidase